MKKSKIAMAILMVLCVFGTTACSLNFLPSSGNMGENDKPKSVIDELVKPVSADDIQKTSDISIDTEVGSSKDEETTSETVTVTPAMSLEDLVNKYLKDENGVVESDIKLSGLETIKMENVNYPLNIKLGNKFELEGQITCSGKIFNELIGEVIDTEGNVVLTATGALNNGTYNIRPNIVNTGIKFGKLQIGTYTYKLYVDGPDVDRVEIFAHDFKVVEK